MRDPQTYHDPLTFNPSRFLGPNPELDPRELAFGFGRRICPARDLAYASMFATITKCLAVFDVTKARDEMGIEIQPVCEYTNGIIR